VFVGAMAYIHICHVLQQDEKFRQSVNCTYMTIDVSRDF